MSTRARGIRIATIGAVIVLAFSACAKQAAPEGRAERRCGASKTLEIGDSLPDACGVVSFADGKTITLGAARAGRPLVLNFWASWCVYCIKEMPAFQRVFERAAGRVGFLGLDLLGVQAETEQAAKALAIQTGVRYPLAYDTDGEFYRRVCPCGGRPIMPATVFVAADGSIAYLKFGPLDDADLADVIRTHLDSEI